MKIRINWKEILAVLVGALIRGRKPKDALKDAGKEAAGQVIDVVTEEQRRRFVRFCEDLLERWDLTSASDIAGRLNTLEIAIGELPVSNWRETMVSGVRQVRECLSGEMAYRAKGMLRCLKMDMEAGL